MSRQEIIEQRCISSGMEIGTVMTRLANSNDLDSVRVEHIKKALADKQEHGHEFVGFLKEYES